MGAPVCNINPKNPAPISLAPALQAYVDRVQEHPAVARWMREAEAETEVLPD
jgi:glutathione S-transferase